MIIFRYLLKEVSLTALAATAFLLLIFLSTQFIHYLTAAAGGRYTTEFLLHIMLLQVPYLLCLLLPLGFFMSLLLAYGRLYADREMIVLFSSGFRPRQLLSITMAMAVVVMLIVAFLSLWLSPYIATEQTRLSAEAKVTPLIDIVLPGRFFTLDNGNRVFYVEAVSRDHQNLKHLFFAEHNKPTQAEQGLAKGAGELWTVITAADASQDAKGSAGAHALNVNQGYRYSGVPGSKDFHIENFGKLAFQLPQSSPILEQRNETLATAKLWQGRKEPINAAELQWRVGLPLSVLILAVLAYSLSKVNPRQGKYSQLLPAVLIYIFYANMLFVSRDWVRSGFLPPFIGFCWLHGLLLLVALTIMFWQSSWRVAFRKYRSSQYYENSLSIPCKNNLQ